MNELVSLAPYFAPALGAIVWPKIEEMVKDLVKDQAKDFCGDAIKSVLAGIGNWPEIAAEALAIFSVAFMDELRRAEEDDEVIDRLSSALVIFLLDKQVRLLIGQAVTSPAKPLTGADLEAVWNRSDLGALPADFSWTGLARLYARRARDLRTKYPDLAEGLEAIYIEKIKDVIVESAPISPGFDLRRYRDGLLAFYQHLKLDSLDTDATHRSISLWNVFVPQNVRPCQEFNPRLVEFPKELREKILAARGDAEEEGKRPLLDETVEELRKAYLQQTPKPVFEVTGHSDARLLVILGDPGSGKSVLLQYLAMKWAMQMAPDLEKEPVPLLIELRRYVEFLTDGKITPILDYLATGTGIPGQFERHALHARLEDGQAYFLFDGLDEIFDLDVRRSVMRELVRLSNLYPRVKIIVTSRIIGYEHEILRSGDFQHYMLQDLEPDQIESFIQKWHALAYGQERDRSEKSESLRKAIAESRAIRELAQNPLLLTLMALLNRSQELPRDRWELYDQASRLLLHKWRPSPGSGDDPDRPERNFDVKEKQAILCAVAAHAQASRTGLAGNAIPQDELRDVLTKYLESQGYRPGRPIANRLIDQLRGQNFILCFLGAETYAFVHRTFLEFFCAMYFRNRFEKDDDRLTIDQLREETFGRHWEDETWHEVLRLLAAAISPGNAAKLIEPLLREEDREKATHIFLAAQCWGEVSVAARSTMRESDERIREKMVELLEFDLPFSWEDLISGIDRGSEIRRSSLRQMLQTWPDTKTRDWLKSNASGASHSDVRAAAVQELARGWRDDTATLILLRGRAENDESEHVRAAAVRELARGWRDDPTTLIWLRGRAENDAHDVVRQAAVQELARGWHDDTATMIWLRGRAENDDNEDVRVAAVRELARGWHDDTATMIWLRGRAENDDNEEVRAAGVRELARGWRDDPATLIWVRGRAENDDDEYVRVTTVHELARGWPDDTATLIWLRGRAENDDNEYVRAVAIHELAHALRDDTATLILLRERAENDDSFKVRQAALQELARGWPEDPETLRILRTLAENDQNTDVRRAAVQELSRGWPDDPDVQSVLAALKKS